MKKPADKGPAKPKGKVLGKVFKYGVPLIVSVGLCYVLFTGLDLREMVQIMRTQCRFGWIAAAMCVSVLSFVCRAMRWGIQLRALGVNPPVHALIYSIFGTYGVNMVFPRLGEFWRCGYISQRQNANFATVLGSMIADRISDVVPVLMLGGLAFALASGTINAYMSENSESYRSVASLLASPWVWLTVAAVVSALWFLMRRRTANPVVVRIQKALRELWQGFAVVLKMPGRGRWLLWTVGIWTCFFVQMWLCFQAFPFTAAVADHAGLTAVLVTFVLGAVAMGVPSNGGIGPWQWAVMFALGIYGVDTIHGAAFANLVLGTQTLMNVLLGILTFILIALDRKKLKSNKT